MTTLLDELRQMKVDKKLPAYFEVRQLAAFEGIDNRCLHHSIQVTEFEIPIGIRV